MPAAVAAWLQRASYGAVPPRFGSTCADAMNARFAATAAKVAVTLVGPVTLTVHWRTTPAGQPPPVQPAKRWFDPLAVLACSVSCPADTSVEHAVPQLMPGT